MMRQEINDQLNQGNFRIICTQCGHIFVDEYGDMTEWAIKTSRQSEICSYCGGEVILEANPKQIHNKYDKEHPYPDNK